MQLDAETNNVDFNGHTEATFEVPIGAGTRQPVVVRVGGRVSEPAYFAYDPPFIVSVTPNEFDADSDIMEIYGRNFGSTLELAGDVVIAVGNNTCGPVVIGGYEATVWQTTRAGTPYLWCAISHNTVGSKAISLFIAGQNVTKNKEDSGLRATCSSGFYGQEAWTVFTNSNSECEMPCSREDVNAHNPEGTRKCTARYDSASNEFVLDSPFVRTDLECTDDWSCMLRAELATGLRSNCTILTNKDEFCSKCPMGSSCDDFTTLYSVEPISTYGFGAASSRTAT